MKTEEVELIHKWANNPDVIPFWYGRKKSLKEIRDDWKPHYFSDRDPYSGRCFAIVVRDEIVGMINYNKVDRDNRNVTIDVIIGEKTHWDKGYGTEAMRIFLSYLFEKFKLNRIWLGTYTFNHRAIRAYEKVGFNREGILREDALIQGKFVDTIIFSILRREFIK